MNHQLFLYQLATTYHLHTTSTSLVQSFLSDRTMVVEVDGVKSSPRPVLSGVPQGSVPSPLFFALFIDQLRFVLRHCKYHFYADDLQIYLSGDKSDIDGMVARVNEDLEAIFRWSTDNGLVLNSDKTQAMLIANGAPMGPLPNLSLGGVSLNWKDVVLDLGLLIDSELNFDRHVTKISSEVYGTLHRLRLLKFLTPKAVRLKLCKALLIPKFLYCNVIYSGIRSMDLDRLEVAFNSCTRYVFGLRYYDRLRGNRNVVLGMPFRKFFDYRLSLFFFRLVKSQSPGYLFADLNLLSSARTGNFDFPSGYHAGSVLARGIRLYNNFPLNIKNSRSVAVFERAILPRFRTT